jgi:hypothetical protein
VGLAHHWIELGRRDVGVDEFYLGIPYRQEMIVMIVADEDEVAEAGDEDDRYDHGNDDFDD